jgi:hypothetical protein
MIQSGSRVCGGLRRLASDDGCADDLIYAVPSVPHAADFCMVHTGGLLKTIGRSQNSGPLFYEKYAERIFGAMMALKRITSLKIHSTNIR